MAEPINEVARQIAAANFDEARRLEAEAESLPRWRWLARWCRRDEARTIRQGTTLFLREEKFRDAVERTTGWRP